MIVRVKSIAVKPIGQIGQDTLSRVIDELRRHSSNVTVLEPTESCGSMEYLSLSPKRGTLCGDIILEQLKEIRQNTGHSRIVGITERDFSPIGLTFSFGFAYIGPTCGTAFVSTFRLREEFYGRPRDDKKLSSRIMRVVRHELGHTHGLRHCAVPTIPFKNRDCLMNAVGTIVDLDFLAFDICTRCRTELKKKDSVFTDCHMKERTEDNGVPRDLPEGT